MEERPLVAEQFKNFPINISYAPYETMIQTTIINTTPHAITEMISGITYPSDPNHQVRISETLIPKGLLGSTQIPLFSRMFGELYNLPLDVKPNQYYLVSLLVKQARPHRSDLLCLGELVRDEKGVIIGCKGFMV